ncbi:MAG: thiamine phosphate synthase [Chloroflexi bacterium]|nr:thiamine phosphate synthase [Chloroflexota bacterium]
MKLRRLPETDLYGITASQFSLGRSNIEVVKQMLEAGIKIIQYREKDMSMLGMYRECTSLRDLTARYGACFIVNDYIDLAMAVESDGVHIGQDDLPPEKVRSLVGDKMLIGLSTHSPEQADIAAKSGIADYIGVGPLYKTFTKKDVQPPVGLQYLDYVVAKHELPFVAIGGIKETNVTEVIKHGARYVCLVTDIVGAQNIGLKIQSIREQVAKARA